MLLWVDRRSAHTWTDGLLTAPLPSTPPTNCVNW